MRVASWLRSAAFLLLAAPAVLRALVAMAPNPFFSIDPRVLAVPLEGLGPGGSVTLDALALLGCLAAITAEVIIRRHIDLKVLLLFVIPIPILAWNGWGDAEQIRAGSQWIGALATAVGAAHLAREVRWRILLLGAAVALTIPLAIKGIYQVTIEYGDTLRSFEQNKAAILQSQGWEPGSSAAEIYVRRLTQREATGWLSLSNVYGSVMAMLATFWVGASLAVARSKLQSGWLGVTVMVAAAALAGLTVSFSKGAVAAAVIGLVLAAMCLIPRRWKQHVRPLTAKVTLALIATAMVVTALRGALFPDSLQGVDGYSLLFRWHYWIGAARMVAAHPLTGVGPDGFQNAYLLVRPLLSPEEVASPHNVFIDWLAGGGVSMVAWIGLTLLLLARAAPSGTQRESSPPESVGSATAGQAHGNASLAHGLSACWVWSSATALALFAGGAAWYLNRRTLLIDYNVLLMPLSLLGMAGAVALVEYLVRHVSLGMLRWAVWAALTVALLHSQIEMTMSQVGSAAIVMLLLGTASARSPGERGERATPPDRSNWLALIAMAVLAAGQVALVAVPIVRIQSHLRAAHDELESVAIVRDSLTRARDTRNFEERLGYLKDAEVQLRRHGVTVDLEGTWREIQSAVRLNDGARVQRLISTGGAALDAAMQRLDIDKITAAQMELEQARHLQPLDDIVWRESSELWMQLAYLHGQAGDTASRDEAADLACQLAEELARRRSGLSSPVSLAAKRWIERFRLTSAPESLDNAVEWQKRVVALDPNGLEVWHALAGLLDQAERRDEALAAYRRTLEVNENMRLDPLKQLSTSQRDDIGRRIESLSGG